MGKYLNAGDGEVGDLELDLNGSPPVLRLLGTHGRQPEVGAHEILPRTVELRAWYADMQEEVSEGARHLWGAQHAGMRARPPGLRAVAG